MLLFLQTCHKPATLHRAQWCVVVTTTELVLLHGDGLGVGGGEMSVVVGGSLRGCRQHFLRACGSGGGWVPCVQGTLEVCVETFAVGR